MSRSKGYAAEERAKKWLQKAGFRIIDQNFSSRFGEIDLIAEKEEAYHFIEVKSGERFEPVYAVTPKKIEKILKTVQFYIMKKKIQCDYCIDALIIKNDEIELIENITV
jgi:putative endonuclease